MFKNFKRLPILLLGIMALGFTVNLFSSCQKDTFYRTGYVRIHHMLFNQSSHQVTFFDFQNVQYQLAPGDSAEMEFGYYGHLISQYSASDSVAIIFDGTIRSTHKRVLGGGQTIFIPATRNFANEKEWLFYRSEESNKPLGKHEIDCYNDLYFKNIITDEDYEQALSLQ